MQYMGDVITQGEEQYTIKTLEDGHVIARDAAGIECDLGPARKVSELVLSGEIRYHGVDLSKFSREELMNELNRLEELVGQARSAIESQAGDTPHKMSGSSWDFWLKDTRSAVEAMQDAANRMDVILTELEDR